jgi:hypothetical protein
LVEVPLLLILITNGKNPIFFFENTYLSRIMTMTSGVARKEVVEVKKEENAMPIMQPWAN